MKPKICPSCGGMVTGYGCRKFCEKCRPHKENPTELKQRFAFQAEWTRWKRDFAAGKTTSNL